ncbi:MAG: alpha/beta hydrolase [Planctomycetota bacterium]
MPLTHAVAALTLAAGLAVVSTATEPAAAQPSDAPESRSVVTNETVLYKTVGVNGLDIFYREAGDRSRPTILLLHGFPTSSHMFRDLIPLLSDDFHVIAPDLPGFGESSAPAHDEWEYTFDNLAGVIESFTDAVGLETYSLYVMDYGAPVGYRLATARPDRVEALIVQNGNAYEEGLDNPFWAPIKRYWADPSPENRDALRGALTLETTKWQYTHGVRNVRAVNPDAWNHAQAKLDRPGNNEIQLDLFLDYGSNPPLYPEWQQYFRDHQPPTLVVWGKNDQIFPDDGAYPYLRDLTDIHFQLYDTGHFALEEDAEPIAAAIARFVLPRFDSTDGDASGRR